MIDYFLTLFRKKISPSKAVVVFRANKLTQKQYTSLFKKSGISISGTVKIIAPLYFEFSNIKISNSTFINTGCVLIDNAEIRIGENVKIGPHVTLCTSMHATSPVDRENETSVISKPISIENNAWIGAGSVVLAGVNIGENSVIGANSVVNCNIPQNQLWAGSPAKFKKNLV